MIFVHTQILPHRRHLRIRNLPNALEGEVEELVELAALEDFALGRSLDLDDGAGRCPDHVHVHLGAAVLGVVEIEAWLAIDDADADGRDWETDRVLEDDVLAAQLARGQRERHEAARDRGGPRPAIGFEYVAVDGDGARAEQVEVDRGAQ